MRRSTRTLLILTAAALVCVPPIPVGAAESTGTIRRILVKTRNKEAGNDLETIAQRAGAGRSRRQWSSGVTRWHVVEIDDAGDSEAIMRRMRLDPGIEAVEPERQAIASRAVPDDLSVRQWALENFGQVVNGVAGVFDADIDAPEAWDLTRGDRAVVVAVLDTGIQTDHPDLEGNLVPGYDFVNGDGNPWDDAGAGHGTPVAGVIGAVGDNGTAMAGVNWIVSLLPVKVCGSDGVCPYSAIAKGIDYAVAQGAQILNMSFSCDEHLDSRSGSCDADLPGACRSEALLDALRAAREKGVLAVTAAGNCGADVDDETKVYPCAYDLDNVLCVGASDSRDELAPFSNYGEEHVRVAAPGTEVLSLSTYTDFTLLWDGTSFSAPLVSGVAALQLARNRTLTPAALAARMSPADPLPALAGYVSHGARLNALDAVRDLFLAPLEAASHEGGRVGLAGDFDGDGLLDLCEGSRGEGHRVARGEGPSFAPFTTWSHAAPARVEVTGDFDGDGRDDIARLGRRGVEVMLSTGSGFTAPRIWAGRARARAARAADLDGDGRSDIVLVLDRKKLLVAISTGAGFSRPTVWESTAHGGFGALADLDGDGRADLVQRTSQGLVGSYSTGRGFGAAVPLGVPAATTRLVAGDVDGDGDADLASHGRDGCWSVMISGGGRLSAPRPWTCVPAGAVSIVGDADADGRADLVTLDPAEGWQLHLSRR